MINNFIKSEKGEEKIFSIWWFFVIAVVGLGIIMSVSIFYGAEVDARQTEANILYEKVANCLIEDGFIDHALDKDFNLSRDCSIPEIVDETSSFYLRFNFSNEDGSALENGKRTSFGTIREVECDLILGFVGEDERPKAESFPRCVKRQERVLYTENGVIRKAILEILVASNNKGEELLQ